jgi:proteic killer suppression protein
MEIKIHKNFYKGPPDGFDNYCKRNYGNQTSKLIARRINNIVASANLSVLLKPGFPGRWHWLTGDRKYQISADLIHPKRLIFIPEEEPKNLLDLSGNLDNKKVLSLIMWEITDTHNE